LETIAMKGLIIRSPWIDKIIAGEKTWELRKKPTNIRETIALIRGGSGLVVGTARLADCLGPFSRPQLRERFEMHRAPDEVLADLGYESAFTWVLDGAAPLPVPRPYQHPSGAVIWVDLPFDVLADGGATHVPGERRLPMASPPAEAVRVPVASDGTEFLPKMRRPRGYQVGAKGSETWLDDYWVALRALEQMELPKWRRPNPDGNWGIMTAREWKTYAKEQLQAQLDEVDS
jgi:hypothetical protein